MAKKKICKLNPEENKVWNKTFGYYVDDEHLTPSKADRKTFTEMKRLFPRLKKCEKIK